MQRWTMLTVPEAETTQLQVSSIGAYPFRAHNLTRVKNAEFAKKPQDKSFVRNVMFLVQVVVIFKPRLL